MPRKTGSGRISVSGRRSGSRAARVGPGILACQFTGHPCPVLPPGDPPRRRPLGTGGRMPPELAGWKPAPQHRNLRTPWPLYGTAPTRTDHCKKLRCARWKATDIRQQDRPEGHRKRTRCIRPRVHPAGEVSRCRGNSLSAFFSRVLCVSWFSSTAVFRIKSGTGHRTPKGGGGDRTRRL